MHDRPRTTLTKEELMRAEIPMNHVLIEMKYKSEDLKTHAGIQIGFNPETLYAEGEGSHVADVAETWGIVTKVPNSLFFEPGHHSSMDWETEMELIVDDVVFFNILESKNSPEVFCEGKTYKSIPYADCYCYKREVWVSKFEGKKKTVIGMLNGYVLCKQCFLPKLSPLDALSEAQVDKSRGIIAYIGNSVKRYARDQYCDIPDLKIGDEVIFEPRAPLFLLERLKETAVLDGNLYWVTQRRRIIFVNNK